MKTKEIIDTLSDKEKKEFQQVLSQHKRASLEGLFKIISKSEDADSIEKQILFKAISKEKYTNEKDYLLRNELRLLNDELEQFVIEVQIKEKLNEDYFSKLSLIKFYLSRQSFDLFEIEWRALFKKVNDSQSFKEANELVDIWVTYVTQVKENHIKMFSEARTLLLDYYGNREHAYFEDILEYEGKIQFVNRALFVLNKESYAFPERRIEYNYKAEEYRPVHTYFENRTATFNALVSKEERLNSAVNMIRVLKEIVEYNTDYYKYLISTYVNLGVEYLLDYDYKNATYYCEEALNLAVERKSTNLYGILVVNIISANLGLENYEACIAFYKKYESLIRKEPKSFHQIRALTCITYLFLDNPEACLKILDEEVYGRPDEHFYYLRVIYVLARLQKGDFDEAEREASNAYKALNYKPLNNKSYSIYFTLVQRLIQAMFTPDKDKKAKKLQEVKDKIQEEQNADIHTNLHTFKLLSRYIDKTMA